MKSFEKNGIKFLFLLSITSISFSCKNKDYNKDYIGGIITQDIPTIVIPETPKTLKFSELFGEIKYLPLIENSSYPLIGEIYKIKSHDNHFFLFDDLNYTIHVINSKGEITQFFYASSFEDQALLLDIEDFFIQEEKIYIYERSRQKIIIFNWRDGDFLRSISSDVYFVEFEDLNGQIILYADDNNFQEGHPKRGRLQVYENSLTDLVLSTGVYIIGRDDFDSPQRFFKFNGKLFFLDIHNDTIFSFNNQKIKSEFLIDFGSKKIPQELIKSNDNELITSEFFKKNYIGFSHYLIATSEIVAFWYRSGFDQFFVWYDNRQKITKNINGFYDDLDGGTLPFPYTYDASNDIFISIIPKEWIDKEKKILNPNSNLKTQYSSEVFNYLVFYSKK